jgi:fluoride exporter
MYFWVAGGSALGGVARYWLSGVSARLVGETFPWGTLLVKLLGTFRHRLFGTLTGPDGRLFVASTVWQFVVVVHDLFVVRLSTLYLLDDGEWLGASGNVVA